MKKFDIKWLLILVLVVVLAFGLVACNKSKGNETPSGDDDTGDDTPVTPSTGNKSTPAVFFQELWTASKSLGATVVDPQNDKIKIAIEGDMEYSSDKVAEGSTDIGLEAGIVLDLKAANTAKTATTGPSLGDTALKLKFYDKTDANKKNWFTVWYFFNDESKIYFQVKNEYFILGFDAYWNAQFTTLLGEVVNDDSILSGLNNITPFASIMDVVNHIAASGGSDWSLDKLIVGTTQGGRPTSLLGLFGLNLADLLNNDLVKSVLQIDTSKDVSLEGVLKTAANIILDKKNVTKEVKGDVTYYTAKGLGSAKGILNGMIDGLLDYYDIALSFGTDGTKFHGFTIEIFGNKKSYNADLKINITKMAITKETAAASASLELPAASTFKTNAAFDIKGEMVLDEDNVVVINPNNVAIGFGTYSFTFKGSVDLTGPAAENKTAAQLQIIAGRLTEASEKTMLTATYKDRTLSIRVNPSNPQAAAILKAGLPSLADAIKAASTGKDAEVPFALFTTMADDVMSKAFTDNTYATVDPTFTGIEVTGVDIATLAKGAFYAIFQNVATHIDDEKNVGAVATLETYKGDTYKIGTKYYKDSQYAWSLNILNLVQAVIGNISYNATSKDYTLGFDNIYTLLSGIFKDAKVQPYKDAACETADGAAKDVTKPADVNEMMALFMCTNDGLLKELTNHGILPLYRDGITTKYLSKTYTPEMAAAEGYYYVSGKMISKADALAIWDYICGNEATLEVSFNGDYTYYNCDEDPDKTTEAGFVENSLINWFFKFIRNSSVLTNAGSTPAAKIEKLAGAGSRIAIDLNKDTGYFGAHIALNGKQCNGTFEYDFTGTDTAFVPTLDAGLGSDSGKYTTVALDSSFYTLFKAAYGLGYGTSVELDYGINNSIFYVVDTLDLDTTDTIVEGYTLAADHEVIVLTSATECKIYTTTGITSATYTVDDSGIYYVTVGSDPATQYKIWGTAFKLAQEI